MSVRSDKYDYNANRKKDVFNHTFFFLFRIRQEKQWNCEKIGDRRITNEETSERSAGWLYF